MMIGEFIDFYPAYTVDAVLAMYAVTFYSMYSAMFRLKGKKNKEIAIRTAVSSNGGDEFKNYMESQSELEIGAKGLLKQARLLRRIKK